MTGNTFSALEIVNEARKMAGEATVTELSFTDKFYLTHERARLFTKKKFSFAKKRVDLAQLEKNPEGGYRLPADFLAAVKPTFLERIGDRVVLCTPYGTTELEYIFDETLTENYEINFVNLLTHQLATRYALVKVDTERVTLLQNASGVLYSELVGIERSNKPIRHIG